LHVGLELGGNDPAYVAADADIAKSADNIVDGACYNAGQSCCAVERVYVHESVYDRFIEAALPHVRAYIMGDPTADGTSLGPIAQPYHAAELEGFVDDSKAKGAKLLHGGRRAQAGGRGRFFEATMLVDVPQSAALMQKESFGPIVAVARVKSDEEALARMNDSQLGLTASIWTNDRDRAARMARSLDFGTILMNRCDALDPALPWTGVKDSGRGVTLSQLGFDFVTRPKAIHFRVAF
jgi:acyl-CoA reductase-like NAD-dependent aldehyde dehydrogenase